MKALILDALKSAEDLGIPSLLKNLLAEMHWEAQAFNLGEMEVKPCTSCGHCAAKTPGRCSIRDDMEPIYRYFGECRLMIFCTPVSFGGYHSTLKLVLDRFMPMNTALFTIRKGELHHENRYQPAPSLMTVGILKHGETETKKAEAEAFKYLTQRNAINMNIAKWASVVAHNGIPPEELLQLLDQAIKEVG